ncbi:Uncharacterized protein SCF082_LOCUS52111 [Durusdinium trenchii]|uniref:Transmembrane protein n=1 Tax=Durusdinium trenchii TaxID=1381693 RepID=A0ABP0SJG8_9DINO
MAGPPPWNWAMSQCAADACVCENSQAALAESIVADSKAPTPATIEKILSPLSEASEGDSELSQVVQMSSRMRKTQDLEVDAEMVRGIPLQLALRSLGKAFRRSPESMTEEQCARLFEQTTGVEQFDLFISHTWQTPGRWKYLSFILQSSWKLCISLWLILALVAWLLCIYDLFPMPFQYTSSSVVQADSQTDVEIECPLGILILVTPILASFIGCLAYPYLPCVRSKFCFYDAASIHQADPVLMRRGIYGIGGFLRVSKELRVLWSPPYLERLWCVFELAAYRHANPKGKLVFAPLFVEMVALALWLNAVLTTSLLWCTLFAEMTNRAQVLLWFVTTWPLIAVLHLSRNCLCEKNQLLRNLAEFDLHKAHCLLDSDEQFVHQAVQEWYGSAESFNRYVRGPMRQELLEYDVRLSLPLPYYAQVWLVYVSASLEELLSLMKGGIPMATARAFGCGHTIGMTLWIVMSLKLMLKLCDRYSAPHPNPLCNCGKSLLIYFVTMMIICVGSIVSFASIQSQLVAAGWGLCSIIMAFFFFGGLRRST